MDIACVDHAETPFCGIQCKVQRIVAHHPDRGDCHFHGAGTVMGVAEHQIGADPLPGNDIFLREPCQEPDLLPLLQRPGSLIADALPQQLIGKAECVHVLYHLIAVRHHAQHLPVRTSHICLIPFHHFIIARVHRLLHHLPVKSRKPQRLR